MTGYAQARAEENGLALRVSIRSVNHRFLDLHVRLPEGWEPLEPRLRQHVRQHVRRGHVDVTLRVESTGPVAVQLNRELAAAYARAAIPARYAVERRQWREAAALPDPAAGKFPYIEAMTLFARAVGAARSGDPGAAEKDVARLAAVADALKAANNDYWATEVEA